MTDAAEIMRQRLQADLRQAMKAHDKARLDVLRALISAIDNAGAIALDAPEARDHAKAKGYSQHVVTGGGKTEVTRKVLSADEVAALFQREAAERRAAADDIAQYGKIEEAELLRAGAALIENYLEP